jgi:hypothetical protein
MHPRSPLIDGESRSARAYVGARTQARRTT